MSAEQNKTIVRRFSEELISTGNMAVADELLKERQNYGRYSPLARA